MSFLNQVFKKAKRNTSFSFLRLFLGVISFLGIVLAGSLLLPEIDFQVFQQNSVFSIEEPVAKAQQGGNQGGGGDGKSKPGFRDAINTGGESSILGGIVQNIFTLIIWILFGIAELLQSITLAALELFMQVAEYNNFTQENTVQLGWTMVRDVANMFFIVALLVIAFANILGVENYEMKTTLPRLFLMAILVNFSKLICGIIIDAAHVFTITFLNAVSASAGGNLVGAFGLGELWNTSASEFENLRTKSFLSGVYAVLITLLTAFTIGAYFVMILGRMVVLWILIILSPLAFIANVLPKTQSIAQDWWGRFIRHVMVAPVIVFFLWLAFATLGTGDAGSSVIGQGQDLPDDATLENVTVGLADWDKLLTFVITVGFLWAGLEVAQNKLGTRGAGAAGKAQSLAKGAVKKAGSIAAKPVTAPAKAIGGKVKESAGRAKRSVTAGLSKEWQERVKKPFAEKSQNLQEGETTGITGGRLSTLAGKAIQTGEQAEATTKRREREAERSEERVKAYARGGAEAGLTGAEAREKQERKNQQKERASEFGEETSDKLDVAESRIEGRGTDEDDIQNTADALVAGFQDGGYAGEKIMNMSAAQARGDDEISDNDIKTYSDPGEQVKKALEGLLGKELQNSKQETLESANEELKDTLGAEEYRATMENLESNLKAAAKQGRVNNAGIIKDGELNVEVEDDEVKASIEDERIKRAGQVNPKEVTNLDNITGQDRDLSPESDDLSRKQLMSFLNSTGNNTNFNNNFKEDMADLNTEEIEGILGDLSEDNKAAAKNINESIYGGNYSDIVEGERDEEDTETEEYSDGARTVEFEEESEETPELEPEDTQGESSTSAESSSPDIDQVEITNVGELESAISSAASYDDLVSNNSEEIVNAIDKLKEELKRSDQTNKDQIKTKIESHSELGSIDSNLQDKIRDQLHDKIEEEES